MEAAVEAVTGAGLVAELIGREGYRPGQDAPPGPE
jgi:hypothetical protein